MKIVANEEARLRWCYETAMTQFVRPIMSYEVWLQKIDEALEESKSLDKKAGNE